MAPDHYHHVIQKLNDIPALFPNIGISASVLTVMGTGIAAILFQAATPTGSSIEHLTLDGALVVAVGVLWRSLGNKDAQIATKDAQLLKSTEAVTTALVAQSASNIELRGVIEHLKESLSQARK